MRRKKNVIIENHQKVSGFTEKGADLWGGLGKFRESLGNYFQAECTAVAAIQLRMRILTRPKNKLLANFRHQISNKRLRIQRCEGIR